MVGIAVPPSGTAPGAGVARRVALGRQNIQLQPGDAILINTGWHKLWAKDNARYNKSCPGIGVAAAEWIAKQDPMLVGADNGPVEVSPNPDTQLSLPVHQIMLVVNGIHILENLKLDELSSKKSTNSPSSCSH